MFVMSRGFGAREVRIGAGPVAGLVSRAVADKITEQRTLFGSAYEKNARIRQGWPSALTRELELRRALAVDPNAKFQNEKDDPEFDLNEDNMIKTIADADVEVGVLYDKYNRLISFTKGSRHSVNFDALASQMEGGTTIHNHPEGGPPSNGDIAAHLHYKSAATKIVSAEGIYTITGSGSKDGVKDELWHVQAMAVSRGFKFARQFLSNSLTSEQMAGLKKASTMEDVKRELPPVLYKKVEAIINKTGLEDTRRAAARYGVKIDFKPSARFKEVQGFSNFDEVPVPAEGWESKED